MMLLVWTNKGRMFKISEAGVPLRRLYGDSGRRYYPKGIKIIDLDKGDFLMGVMKI